MKLYEMASQYEELSALAATCTDEADAQAFADTLEGLEGEIETKVENCAAVVKSIDAEAKALRDEETRLAARRRSIENGIDRLKRYMQNAMETVGVERIKGKLFTVSIADNPPSVVCDNEDGIPMKFKEVKTTVMKSVLKDAIKNGEEVPGAHLEYSRSLRIR